MTRRRMARGGSQPQRVVAALADAGKGGLTPTDIATATRIAQTAVHNALHKLLLLRRVRVEGEPYSHARRWFLVADWTPPVPVIRPSGAGRNPLAGFGRRDAEFTALLARVHPAGFENVRPVPIGIGARIA